MRVLFEAFVFAVLGLGQAGAATFDFDLFSPGVATTPLQIQNAAIAESSGGALFVYGTGDFGMPARGGVCALQTEFACTGDVLLLFIGPVSNLTFKGFYGEVADRATISAYSGDELLAFLLVSGNADGQVDVDFGGISGITRVQIENLSGLDGKGIAYGDFNFDVDPPGTPPPSPLPPVRLNFDSLPRGVNKGLINLGNAILAEASGGEIFVYRTADYDMPQNGGFCALQADFSCTGNFLLEFTVPVSNLIFSGFFAKITDSAFVSLFDGDVLVYAGLFLGNSAGTIRFDFRDIDRLTRILIEDRSDPETGGIAYGDFRYDLYESPIAPVPVPLSLLLLIVALISIRLVAQRRTIKS